MIEEIEDLTDDEIKKYLKDAKIIKYKDKEWYKRPVDEVVHC